MSVSNMQRAQQHSARGLTVAVQMLSELQTAHSSLLAAMRDMERVAQPPPKSVREVTAARLKMSQASLARRMLIDHACDFLRARVSESDGRALRALNRVRYDYQLRSTAHVSRWSVAQIARDWTGYCAASRELRSEMARSIEAERSILYAMLQRYRNA